MSNKFMFFENFKETADKLPDDLRLKFYDAMTDYVFKGIEPDDVVISALISAINPVLLEEKRGGSRVNAGRKSKEIKINQKNQIENFEKIENQKNQIDFKKETKKNTPLNPQKENNKNIYTPITPNGVIAPLKVADTQLDLEDAIKKSNRFVKPTVEEIQTYCQEKNKLVDAERFWNFYESKGWKVGKNPMKDWRAAVCNWAKESTVNVARESYIPAIDAEKLKKMASVAEVTRMKMMEQAKLKYGA